FIFPVMIVVEVEPFAHLYVVGLTELLTTNVSIAPSHFTNVPAITGFGRASTFTVILVSFVQAPFCINTVYVRVAVSFTTVVELVVEPVLQVKLVPVPALRVTELPLQIVVSADINARSVSTVTFIESIKVPPHKPVSIPVTV